MKLKKRIQLLLIFKVVELKIKKYVSKNGENEDIEDELSLYTLYKKRLFPRVFNSTPERIAKETKFLKTNLEFYGKLDTEDKVIMALSLLSISIKRMNQ